ncbi:MAG: hypothetical protein U1F57_01315 [bacterium]
MSGPQKLENQDLVSRAEDYLEAPVCSSENPPALSSTDESQVVVISRTADVEYVEDPVAQRSYARPISLTRSPTHVFSARPATNLSDRRAAVTLGSTLQSVVEEMERNGEIVPSQARELAQELSQGNLPSREEVENNPFFNQSFLNTRLDAVIHAVAVRVAPRQEIHRQALALSLNYYLSQPDQNSSDQAIRQGLIVALASDSQNRDLLTQAGQNANADVQAQIVRAMASGAAAGGAASAPIPSGGAPSPASGNNLTTNSPVTASALAQVALRSAIQGAELLNPLAAIPYEAARLISPQMASLPGLLPIQESLLFLPPSASSSSGYPPYLLPIFQMNPPNQNGVTSSNSSSGAEPTADGPSNAHDGASLSSERGETIRSFIESFPEGFFRETLTVLPLQGGIPLPAPLQHAFSRAMTALGIPAVYGDAILSVSPFLLAAASLQAGVGTAALSFGTMGGAFATASLSQLAQHTATSAITSAAESHSDNPNDSHSNGNSSGNSQNQNSSSHQQHSSQEEQGQENQDQHP